MSKPEIDQDVLSGAEDVIFEGNSFDYEKRPDNSCIAEIKRMDRRLLRVKRLLKVDQTDCVEI